MNIKNFSIELKTKGFCDILDITDEVTRELHKSQFTEGFANLFVPGSTAAITTIEYESGAINDLKAAIERLAPEKIHYEHNARWGDGNGFSHVRAALLGPSLTVPFSKSRLLLGTWQQIVLIDFDNRPRNRKIILQISGYKN